MPPAFFRFFKSQVVIFITLAFLVFIAYFNSLDNHFSVIDDYTTFYKNNDLENIGVNLQTFRIQPIVLSLLFNLFGRNPVPFHILSVVLHVITTIGVYMLLYLLSGKKIAFLSAGLFAVHPVNTEAVSWISGSGYLFYAIFLFSIFILYCVYKKTWERKYLYMTLTVFILTLFVLRMAWLFTIPPALIILDQFFWEKKLHIRAISHMFFFVIPLLLFLVLGFHKNIAARLLYREVSSYHHQQSLTPVIESAPYTISTMARLYLFPKDLTVYYDGNPISQTEYVGMYVITFFYIGAIWYVWKKDRRMAGTLLILLVLLGPTFSPIKVTWYMSERYLYVGTAFFCYLLVLILFYLETYLRAKKVAITLILILLIIYTARTIARNQDWSSPKSLAIATIKTSPYSYRAYNDLGGAYGLEGDYQQALVYYQKALRLFPGADVTKRNLEIIYDKLAYAEYQNGNREKAKWYLQKSLKINPYNEQTQKNLLMLEQSVIME